MKTIQPSIQSNNQFQSSLFPKINKRIDSEIEGDSFELLQPSEVSPLPCSSSCSCSQSQTEHLDKYKTKFSHNIGASISVPLKRMPVKVSKFGVTKLEHLRPTIKESLSLKSKYPYEYESNINIAPTDKIVEKYTEVINDYSDEKEHGAVKDSDLLTNEQAPNKSTKNANQKPNEKIKPDKPMKPNKNKFVVADLLKLGSLGIKGLSQLAPVIEKMTEGFMKRQETNKTTSSTTVKAVTNLTPYNVNKRVDSELAPKQGKFPIYIPVDELETSESQLVFTNTTLHQNLFWASDHKHPKAHIMPPKLIHESPLVNGGIPISPGEIITANSDVIVGKPAIGGPLTLAASGIKLQNSVNPPHIDSSISGSEHFVTKEILPNIRPSNMVYQGDDSYDLRPPDLPKTKSKPNRNISKPNLPPNSHPLPPFVHQVIANSSPKLTPQIHNDNLMITEQMKTNNILGNHGRPAFLDYIPALGLQENNKNLASYSQHKHQNDMDIPDTSPSSSEIVSTKIKHEGQYALPEQSISSVGKPFLVDIQPSRVANVLIPHGSATALVFAGSSEPHKTGDYVDDPLPYPEPGYFGSFSIDAPQMTNVHNVAAIKQKPLPALHIPSGNFKPNSQPQKELKHSNDVKLKWKDYRRPTNDFNKLPPPTSNQETHIQIGPHITSYNPDIYKASDFERFHEKEHYHKTTKDVIDKDYENYLAVPPLPPKLMHNNNHEKNRPYKQRPIVHTKPIQDMKVFLNIQHPIPGTSIKNNQEQHPSKVTSEIYFAAQSPEFNKQPSMFNVQIPTKSVENEVNKNSYVSSSNFAIENNESNRHTFSNNYADKDNSYTVTLNAGTNVIHSNSFIDAGQVIGTSIPVQVGTSTNNLVNTNIPIGTNFAIKVEDSVEPNKEYYTENQPNPSNSHDHKIKTNDNRWNATSIHIKDDKQTLLENNKYNAISESTENIVNKFPQHINEAVIPSLNSHANFPMINDGLSTESNDNYNIKQVIDNTQDSSYEGKRPPKLIPNTQSNSHGWYSSVPIKDLNLNTLKNIYDIKIEKSTRQNIPLSHEHSLDSLPDFGQKLSTIGLPPAKFLSSLDTIGKPFTKGNVEESKDSIPQRTTRKPFDYHYLPSNFGGMRQPAYDIPVRDNSDETTTYKITTEKAKVKPEYENSEEVYDGADLAEGIVDGEVSEESMKVPVISTSNTKNAISKSTTQMTLLQEEVFEPYKNNNINNDDKTETELVNFNTGTQTEKPFIAENQSNSFQTNAMKPILESDNYYNLKPRPFTVKTDTILDHQLHQPHWQINQMWENTTNLSSDENIDLNMGEEMSTIKSTKPSSVSPNNNVKLRRPSRPIFSARPNKTINNNNVSNIITSTIHLMDKKPLTVLDYDGDSTGSTLPTFTLTSTNYELNNSSSEIIDLSPPPPTIDYHTPKDEIIMGMSPPPPINPIISQVRPPLPTRSPVTPRTPPPYRSKPPRTLPPRIPFTRPTRKPIKDHKDEVSTYRPSYDILKNNNMRRPGFNVDQPSSQLLPPPRHVSSVVNEMSLSSISNVPVVQNVVFPTPTSSGWLTSSGVGFSSKFDFAPTSVQFPEVSLSSDKSESGSYSTEKSDNTELDTLPEGSNILTTHEPENQDILFKEGEIGSNTQSTEKTTEKSTSSSEEDLKSSSQPQNEEDSISTERVNIAPLRNKEITRKPYPVRESIKKSQSSRYKPIKSSVVIKPTRTLTRSDILYPTKQTSIKKIRPIPTRTPTIRPSLIESSESSIEDEYIKPTEVLKQKDISTVLQYDQSSASKPYDILHDSSIIHSISEKLPVVKPTHHAGNEVKVYDEIVPTKTEFKTTVITLTKTLSEAPQIISSIGYINLTHTLTVTHTKTSLISQSEGAITETIIVTNTQTSTIVDVVTEVYTKVQPTTIIETVTKHIPILSVEPSSVAETPLKSISSLDNVSMSSEEDNLIIKDSETTENIQKIEKDDENDTFFVIMNKSQNGGQSPPIQTDVENSDYEGVTRNEQVNNNGVSQVLFGEILLAGTPFLETTNIGNPG